MQTLSSSFFNPNSSTLPYNTNNNTPLAFIMSRPPNPTPPPDTIDLNAIANPTNESAEILSAPTALFQSDPSTIDSFLSEQCIHPAIANGREKRKSHASIATSPSPNSWACPSRN